MNANQWLQNTALLLARLALGVYFALAGWGKIQGGVEKFVTGFFANVTPDWLPTWLAKPYGYALPWAELIVGLALAAGLFGRIAAAVMCLMLVSFMLAVGVEDSPKPFHANVILATLTLLLFAYGPGVCSIDQIWRSPGKASKG